MADGPSCSGGGSSNRSEKTHKWEEKEASESEADIRSDREPKESVKEMQEETVEEIKKENAEKK